MIYAFFINSLTYSLFIHTDIPYVLWAWFGGSGEKHAAEAPVLGGINILGEEARQTDKELLITVRVLKEIG